MNSGPLPGRWRHFFSVSVETRRMAAAWLVVSRVSSGICLFAIGISGGGGGDGAWRPLAGLRISEELAKGLVFS